MRDPCRQASNSCGQGLQYVRRRPFSPTRFAHPHRPPCHIIHPFILSPLQPRNVLHAELLDAVGVSTGFSRSLPGYLVRCVTSGTPVCRDVHAAQIASHRWRPRSIKEASKSRFTMTDGCLLRVPESGSLRYFDSIYPSKQMPDLIIVCLVLFPRHYCTTPLPGPHFCVGQPHGGTADHPAL
jgi:hypothetical protein